jgi:hypothetical protein
VLAAGPKPKSPKWVVHIRCTLSADVRAGSWQIAMEASKGCALAASTTTQTGQISPHAPQAQGFAFKPRIPSHWPQRSTPVGVPAALHCPICAACVLCASAAYSDACLSMSLERHISVTATNRAVRALSDGVLDRTPLSRVGHRCRYFRTPLSDPTILECVGTRCAP